jgi:hypothetical protein
MEVEAEQENIIPNYEGFKAHVRRLNPEIELKYNWLVEQNFSPTRNMIQRPPRESRETQPSDRGRILLRGSTPPWRKCDGTTPACN